MAVVFPWGLLVELTLAWCAIVVGLAVWTRTEIARSYQRVAGAMASALNHAVSRARATNPLHGTRYTARNHAPRHG